MNHILNMTILGILSGMIACMWTRIIRKNMIFTSLGKWLERQDNNYLIVTSRHSILVKFIRCSFCIHVWITVVLALFYILVFSPWWLFALIGITGGLGSGNLVAEVVVALRNDE